MNGSKDENPNLEPEASNNQSDKLDASLVDKGSEKNNKNTERPLTPDEAFIPKNEKVQEVEIIKEKIPQKNNQVSVVSNKVGNVELKQISTPDQLMGLAKMIVGGGMCPYKSPEDAMIALMAGKELGLGFTATLQGVYPIEGKPSLGVHIKKGVLQAMEFVDA